MGKRAKQPHQKEAPVLGASFWWGYKLVVLYPH